MRKAESVIKDTKSRAHYLLLKRFNNASQLVAYSGIDPQIYQSSQISGLHLKISKKEN